MGIIFLSLGLSNPVFNLIFKKKFKLNIIFYIIFRFFLTLLGILIVFLGLYFESRF